MLLNTSFARSLPQTRQGEMRNQVIHNETLEGGKWVTCSKGQWRRDRGGAERQLPPPKFQPVRKFLLSKNFIPEIIILKAKGGGE